MSLRKVAVVTVSVVATIVPQFTHAQARRAVPDTANTRVLIVSGSGSGERIARGERRERPERTGGERGRPARELTPAQLSQLIKPLGFTLSYLAGPWRLSATQPSAAGGRFAIDMEDITNLFANSDTARMDLTGKVFVRVRALVPNEYYLVNCSARKLFASEGEGRMLLNGPNGAQVVSDADNHVAVYHALDTKTATFGLMPFVKGYWRFHSCEISQLPPPQTPR